MNVSRIKVGLAIGFLGLALTTGTAAAQICTDSVCDNEETTTTTVTDDTTTTTVGDELGTGEEVGLPGGAEPDALGETETVGGTAAAAPEGTLPFTGGDVVGLALIGAAAIGAGALLLRRSKATA